MSVPLGAHTPQSNVYCQRVRLLHKEEGALMTVVEEQLLRLVICQVFIHAPVWSAGHHMQVTCKSHGKYMHTTCRPMQSYAVHHMHTTCRSYVGHHMQVMCTSHVGDTHIVWRPHAPTAADLCGPWSQVQQGCFSQYDLSSVLLCGSLRELLQALVCLLLWPRGWL